MAAREARGSVKVDGLWKAYYVTGTKDCTIAMSDVTLTVPAGQFLSICGPSGCGKTTLLRILGNLEEKTRGSITLDQPTTPAIVFQEASLFPWLTVEENVGYRLRINGVRKAARREKVLPLLELMGLQDFRHSYPYAMSGGMKQRVSVARALADHTEGLLLMDEPFAALDEQTRMALQEELLRVWAHTKATVIFITHSVDEALILSDRVIVLSERPGRIVADLEIPFGRPRDILQLRRDPAFVNLNYEIWSELRSKSESAVGAGRQR